ncbi:L,D-transpeptidase [Siccirubricoccus sp. G192]|uniref:L,D-transpeptidase family protein n=1 Tax=Siccirubricoccus sp. G192 TaxID=2849651 RepID=UPI001C2C8CCF|nr:L,D-transpeptidase family protein [Siccirubricoccus sp. G192]MBV1796009.1 L,D-transpeptidase family protein [Siccirubricoccus sp. G192]
MTEPGLALVTPDGLLRFAGQTWRCALGRGGVRVEKQEGDGATPAGRLPLRRLLYRADRVAAPACLMPAEPIAPGDGWCDDPAHPDYNRQIRLPHPARHEVLWREDALYDLVGVLGWNDRPVVRSRGSAIFLHLARPDYAPTEGCIALPERDLRALLAAGLTAIEVLPAG